MNPQPGYYSLIQYCPDHSRLEAANVGVLLFCPPLDFLDIRLSEDSERLQRFFGKDSFDPGRVESAKKALELTRGADPSSPTTFREHGGSLWFKGKGPQRHEDDPSRRAHRNGPTAGDD